MTEEAGDRAAPSALERVLGVVTEVRAGEGITALLMTLNVFLLLTAYYVIKPVRKGLILAVPNGASYESYLSAAIAVALLFAVPAYARAAGRMPKNKLVVLVTLFFASHLFVFFGLSQIASVRQYLGLVFYVWVGIFNMMVVAQFWAFANDLYTQEQGKRLFALLGLGASVGAAVGAWITKPLKNAIGNTSFGVYLLLVVSAVMLGCCAMLSQAAHRRERAGREPAREEMPPPVSKQAKPAHRDGTGEGAFALVLRHRYLTLIAVFSLLFTWVNTNGEFMMSALVSQASEDAAIAAGKVGAEAIAKYKEGFSTELFADFFLWVNVLGVGLQTFAVSRIVRFGGLRLAFFILPVIALADATLVAALPLLGVLRYGKIAENATDYSVNNTVRNMLWLPTTTEMKYKAKQAVDTFFVRMGDVASAILVLAVVAGGKALAGSDVPTASVVRIFGITNLALVIAWLFVARGIVRENAALSAPRELPEPDVEKAA